MFFKKLKKNKKTKAFKSAFILTATSCKVVIVQLFWEISAIEEFMVLCLDILSVLL